MSNAGASERPSVAMLLMLENGQRVGCFNHDQTAPLICELSAAPGTWPRTSGHRHRRLAQVEAGMPTGPEITETAKLDSAPTTPHPANHKYSIVYLQR